MRSSARAGLSSISYRQVDRAGQLAGIAAGLARDRLDLAPLLAPALRIGRSGTSRRSAARPLQRWRAPSRRPRSAARPAGAASGRSRPARRASGRPSRPACRSTARCRAACLPSCGRRASRTARRRAEFGADVGNVAGDADAEDDPALADLVEGRDLMGQQHRVAQRRQQHRGAELDAPRPRRDARRAA